MYHAIVTAENIEDIREEIRAIDQRSEVEIGCETWSINGGWITVWPDAGRAAIMFGGDSQWGDWDVDTRTITMDVTDEQDESIVYNENGEQC